MGLLPFGRGRRSRIRCVAVHCAHGIRCLRGRRHKCATDALRQTHRARHHERELVGRLPAVDPLRHPRVLVPRGLRDGVERHARLHLPAREGASRGPDRRRRAPTGGRPARPPCGPGSGVVRTTRRPYSWNHPYQTRARLKIRCTTVPAWRNAPGRGGGRGAGPAPPVATATPGEDVRRRALVSSPGPGGGRSPRPTTWPCRTGAARSSRPASASLLPEPRTVEPGPLVADGEAPWPAIRVIRPGPGNLVPATTSPTDECAALELL